MTHFWYGFDKRAETEMPSLISDWAKEDEDEERKAKDDFKIDTKVDPRELSEWQGPEAWYRWGWP